MQNTALHCVQLHSGSCPYPPLSTAHACSVSEPQRNEYLILGGEGASSGSGEMGKWAPHSPARSVGRLPSSRWFHTIWFPSLGLLHLYTCSQACGESIIVHFMVMNGTAWQSSDHHFHSLSCIINLIPHYTLFFFFTHSSYSKDKERRKPCKGDWVPRTG